MDPFLIKVGIMEHFFNHEEERLEFTAARMQQRMVEKKALDIQKVEASTKVHNQNVYV